MSWYERFPQRNSLSARTRTASIDHKPVDRMPIDLGVHYSTGISAFAYYNLRKYLGLDYSNVEVIDCGQFLARVEDDIIERFHIDTMILHPGFPNTRRWNVRGEYEFVVPRAMKPELQTNGAWHLFRPDRPDRRSIMPRNGFFFDGDGGIDMWQFDEADGWWKAFSREAERIHKETDFFTMLCGFPGYFGDIEECCEMYSDPDAFKEKNEKRLSSAISRFDEMQRRIPGLVESIELNGDLGTQNAPYVSVDVYNDCTLPYLKKFCDHVKATSDIKTLCTAAVQCSP